MPEISCPLKRSTYRLRDSCWQKKALGDVGILSRSTASMRGCKRIPLSDCQPEPLERLSSFATGNDKMETMDLHIHAHGSESCREQCVVAAQLTDSKNGVMQVVAVVVVS